jgi:uncharacterized membrane protein
VTNAPPPRDDSCPGEADLAGLLDEAATRGWSDATTRVGRDLLIPGPALWQSWLSRMLLMIGCALIVSGIIHFFAFNWEDMGKWLKLLLIEGLLVSSLIGALLLDPNGLPGKTLRVVAAMLVGVFLAVFGQIYQTGADAWQLFAGWAALISGWTICAALPALWLLQIILLQLTIFLFANQAGLGDRYFLPLTAFVLSGSVGALGLIGQEWLIAQGRTWAMKTWWRRRVFVETMGMLMVPAHLFIWESHQKEGLSLLVGFLLFVGTTLAGGWRFGWHRRDYPSLTVATLLAGILLMSAIAHLLPRGSDPVFFLLFMAILSIGLFVGLTMLVRTIIQRREEGPNHV